MRRTTVKRARVSALLVAGGLVAAVFVPAATASPTSGSDSASGSGPAQTQPASDALLTAMQQDMGLTKGEAKARLAAEKKATAVQDDARRAAGKAYGGSWFDAKSGTLAVALTDKAKADAVRAAGADVRMVRHSAEELTAAKKRIDKLSAPAGVSSWQVDDKSNRIVVSVVASKKSDNDVRAFVADARESGPVTVRETAEAARTTAAGTVGGDPYYTGNVRCSIGFSVHGGFVTAGHCGQKGASVSGWDRSKIGEFQGSTFPGSDMAWVNVANGWWTEPVVLGWGTVSDQLVRGSNEAPIGASICRSGSTTHWHCGNVQAKNVTVNYQQGAVHGMTQTSVCAEGGDSGGSYISGDQAQGITSGGSGNCSSGGTTFFQPLNPVLSHYGLTLHTA
ncbi:S1 family peptidase [Streptomyces armeniacus]|uniref:S1 family peptidase n=1 Tax=Streptomyces armeniacus TaxID=83291 RepID=A0A345XJH6_9ACTN|nr:alpha-lytic protease prodomain-containing protein [Streptomyces armeniacus]AXK31792.1 S1 family peptidase [Streptomyces armeniacus]